MARKISISDEGTYATAILHDDGRIEAFDDGGCPVETILAGIDASLSDRDLEDEIAQRWAVGYEGDADSISVVVGPVER